MPSGASANPAGCADWKKIASSSANVLDQRPARRQARRDDVRRLRPGAVVPEAERTAGAGAGDDASAVAGAGERLRAAGERAGARDARGDRPAAEVVVVIGPDDMPDAVVADRRVDDVAAGGGAEVEHHRGRPVGGDAARVQVGLAGVRRPGHERAAVGRDRGRTVLGQRPLGERGQERLSRAHAAVGVDRGEAQLPAAADLLDVGDDGGPAWRHGDVRDRCRRRAAPARRACRRPPAGARRRRVAGRVLAPGEGRDAGGVGRQLGSADHAGAGHVRPGDPTGGVHGRALAAPARAAVTSASAGREQATTVHGSSPPLGGHGSARSDDAAHARGGGVGVAAVADRQRAGRSAAGRARAAASASRRSGLSRSAGAPSPSRLCARSAATRRSSRGRRRCARSCRRRRRARRPASPSSASSSPPLFSLSASAGQATGQATGGACRRGRSRAAPGRRGRRSSASTGPPGGVSATANSVVPPPAESSTLSASRPAVESGPRGRKLAAARRAVGRRGLAGDAERPRLRPLLAAPPERDQRPVAALRDPSRRRGNAGLLRRERRRRWSRPRRPAAAAAATEAPRPGTVGPTAESRGR